MSFMVSRLLTRTRLTSCVVGVLAGLAPGWALGEVVPLKVTEPLDRPALLSQHALSGVFIDIARAGDRFVAVGERGDIVLSDDNGATWRQVAVPTSVTLDAVNFVDARSGWAVGHSGIVLHTADGGETWTKQLDGVIAGQAALDEAQAYSAAHPGDPNALALVKGAQYLVSDGPDKPFLDIYFTSPKSGFIVGAYGLFFHTADGGETWKPWLSHFPNPGALHLTAIAGKGNLIYVAGEQGLFARSRDGGQTFERVSTPYRGSYFEVAILPDDTVFLAGLRGNAFWSKNEGVTLTPVQSPVPVSFSAALVATDGTLYVTNQGGMLLSSVDGGHSLAPVPIPPGPPIVGLVEAADGSLVAASFQGPKRLPLGQPQKAGE